MNKQELINKLKKLLTTPSEIEGDDFDNGYDFGIERAILLAEGLDDPVRPPEPEKPVLPQFIADWLEVCKENIGFSLSSAMSHSTSLMKAQPNKVQGWFNLKDNQETFAKAWLYGYEVEKEKLYTVEIPNNNQPDHLALWKPAKGEVCINRFLSDNWRDYKCVQLTEAEIKKDFDWAWEFRKELEE